MTILELLPQSVESRATDPKVFLHVLKVFRFILNLSVDAILHFLSYRLYEFDAQVGETLCQIRAYKIFLLSKKLQNEPIFKLELQALTKDLNKLFIEIDIEITSLENRKPHAFFDKNISIKDFFLKKLSLLDLSEDMVFLIKAHFLTRFNIKNSEDIPVGIDYFKIQNEMNVSRYFAKKIAHIYQKSLSRYSCDFILKILQEVPGLEDVKLILPQLLCISDEGRLVLPCFDVTKVILHHMLNLNHKLMIVIYNNAFIEDLYLICYYNKSNIQFEVANHSYSFHEEPIIIFKGTTNFDYAHDLERLLKKIKKISIQNILLSNSGNHPQYSGTKLNPLGKTPYEILLYRNRIINYENSNETLAIKRLKKEFIKLRKHGEIEGCCMENPDTFFLKHICCDTFNHYSSMKYKNIVESMEQNV